jgi:hypothetical protein
MEEAEDVYRFQEFESEDEKNGVLLEPGYQQHSNGRDFNPDELYFNDMDLRAWEARTAEIDGMAYRDEYGYQEDEGYYEEPGRILMTPAEYEEFLFLRVLDKIRLARATGDQDVQLTTEELDAYSKGMRPRAPAARPQPPRGRPVSAPMITGPIISEANNTMMATNATTAMSISGSGSASGSTRRKTSKPRTSIFGSRSKKEKEKSSTRKRTKSNVSETPSQSPQQPVQQPPGFVVPGPNGPVYAPINHVYAGRMRRDSTVRSAGSPSRESRSSSLNSRHAAIPTRITPPREVPGAFPSGSPQRYYRDGTPPPRQSRPPSSHSRYSMGEAELTPNTRSRSSSIQQSVKLVPFPVTEYQHYSAEPYQYHQPGQPTPTQAPAQAITPQPQYRRVVSGSADPNFTALPRRVPVPVQRATGSISASYSDPALTQRGPTLRDEESDEDGGVTVDVVPQADDKNYKATAKPTQKQSSTSTSAKDSERRRSSGRTRRKN